jgi:hypothetical protein
MELFESKPKSEGRCSFHDECMKRGETQGRKDGSHERGTKVGWQGKDPRQGDQASQRRGHRGGAF